MPKQQPPEVKQEEKAAEKQRRELDRVRPKDRRLEKVEVAKATTMPVMTTKAASVALMENMRH